LIVARADLECARLAAAFGQAAYCRRLSASFLPHGFPEWASGRVEGDGSKLPEQSGGKPHALQGRYATIKEPWNADGFLELLSRSCQLIFSTRYRYRPQGVSSFGAPGSAGVPDTVGEFGLSLREIAGVRPSGRMFGDDAARIAA
jgi:hypothetical protein